MLIPFPDIQKALAAKGISHTGAFHVGAHDCEELKFYGSIGIPSRYVVWVEAIPEKAEAATARGIPNVYNHIITDKDDEDISLNVSNNFASSSILELGTHSKEHPHIVYVGKVHGKSITIDTFFERHNIDASKYTFWNFDIQGAELMALKGATRSLQYAKAICLEVNEKELYVGCGLIGDVDAFLSTYNFKRVLTTMTPHGWGDALYLKD